MTDAEFINDLTAWMIAEEEVKQLPPYLADDELTAERFLEKHKESFSNIDDCRNFLEKLVESKRLERQERRRKGRGGSHVFVYMVKEKGKNE